MRKALIVITLGVLLMAACANAPGTGADLPGDVVVEYQRSGGFAGVEEMWTVYSDGRIIHRNGTGAEAQTEEWIIPQEQVASFLASADELGFFKMKSQYMPLDTCCDRFTHTVTVNSSDNSNTVTTIDAAQEAPSELWNVLEEISQLIKQ